MTIIFQNFLKSSVGVNDTQLVSAVWDLINVEINKVSVVHAESVQEQPFSSSGSGGTTFFHPWN